MTAPFSCRSGLVGALVWLALVSPALGRTWRLEAGTETPRIASWGPDCGPRPTPGSVAPGGRYTEDADGALRPEGRAPPLFGPGVCRALTQQPDLREVRTGDAITCASAGGAAKRVDARITRRRLESGLRVDQTAAYSWTLKGTTCEVEVVGRFDLVDDAPPAAPASVDACAAPGPMARLVPTGGVRRLVPVGGRVALGVRALDTAGCVLPLRPTWTTSVGAVTDAGAFDARGLAPGAITTVTARIESAIVEFHIRVAADDADYAALTVAEPTLAEGHLPTLPPQHGEALTGAAADDESTRGATLRARVLVGAFVGLLVVAALLGVVIAVRTARRRRDRAAEVLDARAREVLARSAAARQRGTAQPAPGRICPICGVTYPSDAEFCGTDGARLTRLN
jgi:hypothetical protein